MLSRQTFKEGIQMLGEVFGTSHGLFTNKALEEIWFAFFGRMSDEVFMDMVVHYCANCSEPFFPKTPAILKKLYTEGRPPGENYTSHELLPSSEKREISNLSPEQRELNLKRLTAMMGIVAKLKEMPREEKQSLASETVGLNEDELNSVIQSCKKSKTIKGETRFFKVDNRVAIPKDISDSELLSLLSHEDRGVKELARIESQRRNLDVEF